MAVTPKVRNVGSTVERLTAAGVVTVLPGSGIRPSQTEGYNLRSVTVLVQVGQVAVDIGGGASTAIVDAGVSLTWGVDEGNDEHLSDVFEFTGQGAETIAYILTSRGPWR